MGTAIVGAAAALAGTVLAGLMQLLVHRLTRRERQRHAAADALVRLLGAVAEHREHQYLKIVARRERTPDTVEARRDRYRARTAVTTAMAALTAATSNDELLGLARELVGYSFALGDAADVDVDTVGDQARDAHNALQAATGRFIHQHV